MSALGYGLGAFVEGYIRGDDYRSTKNRQEKLDKIAEEERAARNRRADAAERRASEAHGWRRDEIRRQEELRDAYAEAYEEAAETWDNGPSVGNDNAPPLGATPSREGPAQPPSIPRDRTAPQLAPPPTRSVPRDEPVPRMPEETNPAPQRDPIPRDPSVEPVDASSSLRRGRVGHRAPANYEETNVLRGAGPEAPRPAVQAAPSMPAQPAVDPKLVEVAGRMIQSGEDPAQIPRALATMGVPEAEVQAVLAEAARANGLPEEQVGPYVAQIMSYMPQGATPPPAQPSPRAQPQALPDAPNPSALPQLGAAPPSNQPAPPSTNVSPLRDFQTSTRGQTPGAVPGSDPSVNRAVSPMPAAEIDTGPELADAAADVVARSSTPALDAAAEAAAASGDTPMGAKPGKVTSKPQRERAAKSFMEHYRKVGAPKVVRALLERGEVEKAQQFMEFIEEGQTKAAMEKWATAAFAASVGDFDTFAENAMEAYNDLGYFPDGMEIDAKASGFDKDKSGNITGAKIVFRNSETGDTFTQEFENPIQLVEWGITMLAPEEAFEWRMRQAEAARGALAARAEERKAAADERLQMVQKAEELVNGQLIPGQPISDEERDKRVMDIVRRWESMRDGFGALPGGSESAAPPPTWDF